MAQSFRDPNLVPSQEQNAKQIPQDRLCVGSPSVSWANAKEGDFLDAKDSIVGMLSSITNLANYKLRYTNDFSDCYAYIRILLDTSFVYTEGYKQFGLANTTIVTSVVLSSTTSENKTFKNPIVYQLIANVILDSKLEKNRVIMDFNEIKTWVKFHVLNIGINYGN